MTVEYQTIDRASSGRGRCKLCRQPIAKDEHRLRLGWSSGFQYFHLACGAASDKHAQWLVLALEARACPEVPNRTSVLEAARARAKTHLARLLTPEPDDGSTYYPAADRVGSEAAGPCLGCKVPVRNGDLAILERLGPLHLGCATTWAERHARMPIERWTRALGENTAGLSAEDQAEVERALQ